MILFKEKLKKRYDPSFYKTEDDPFAILDKKIVKITEFLVYLESNNGQDNYVINKFDKTKEQNLEALLYIQNLIRNDPNLQS